MFINSQMLLPQQEFRLSENSLHQLLHGIQVSKAPWLGFHSSLAYSIQRSAERWVVPVRSNQYEAKDWTYLTVLEPTLPVAPATNTRSSSFESSFFEIGAAASELKLLVPCQNQEMWATNCKEEVITICLDDNCKIQLLWFADLNFEKSINTSMIGEIYQSWFYVKKL